MPNTTNSVYVAPPEMNLPFTNADGSLVNSGWSNASFVGGNLTMGGSYGYANRSYTFSENSDVPVQAGHLYALEMEYQSGDEFPPIMGVRISMRNAGGSAVSGPIRRVGGPKGQGTIAKSVVFFHVSDDDDVKTVRLGFNKFIGQLEGSRGTSYLRKLKMVDYGRNFDTGNIWLPTAPATIIPFDSGNNKIKVAATGDWELNGAPFFVKGAFPNWNGDPAASFVTSRDAGFNTCYHVNPALHRSLVPSGMNVMADFTGYMDPSNGLFNNQAYLGAVDDMIAEFGDRWIGVYIDFENNMWDQYGQAQRIIAGIRARITANGSHQRPMLCHCQNQGGAEAFNDLIDVYEYKCNPYDADFGAQDGDPSSYDHVQGQICYAAQRHPTVTRPYTSGGMNTPHTGSRLVTYVMAALAMGGGGGFSLWSDRPTWQYHGHGRGYAQQPWWSDVTAELAKIDLMTPFAKSPATDVYNATVTGHQDGSMGVVRTLRQVGAEIWGVFANKGTDNEAISIATPDQMTNFSVVAQSKGTATSPTDTSVQVNLQSQGYTVFKFTPGATTAQADIELGADVSDIAASTYSTTAVITGSSATAQFLVTLGGAAVPAVEYAVIGSTLTLSPAIRPGTYTVTASIDDNGTTVTDTQLISFAALAGGPLTATPSSQNIGNPAGSTASVAVLDMADGGTEPYTLTDIVIMDSNGAIVTGATAAVIGGSLVITQGTLPAGTYTVQSTLCDSTVEVPDNVINIQTPSAGSTLGTSQEFGVALTGGQPWQLVIGSTPGDSDLFNSGALANSQTTVLATGLPSDGSDLYVTATTTGATDARQYVSGTIIVQPDPVIEITNPLNGATLAQSQGFVVNCTGGDSWTFTAGSSVNNNDYFQSGIQPCSAGTMTAAGWPEDGSTVHISVYEGSWDGTDFVVNDNRNYTFVAPTAGGGGTGTGATPNGYVATPANGSTLGPNQQFIVNSNDTLNYTAEWGTTFGGDDLMSIARTLPVPTTTDIDTYNLTNTPAAGQPVYLKVEWFNGSETYLSHYQYVAGAAAVPDTDGINGPSDAVANNPVFDPVLATNETRLATSQIYDLEAPTNLVKFSDNNSGSSFGVRVLSNLSGLSNGVVEVRVGSPTGALVSSQTITATGGVFDETFSIYGDDFTAGDTAHVGVLWYAGANVVGGNSITFDVVSLTQAEYNAL